MKIAVENPDRVWPPAVDMLLHFLLTNIDAKSFEFEDDATLDD